VPIHFKTPALTFGLHGIEPLIEAVGTQWNIRRSGHNTLAVRSAESDDATSTQVVILGNEPWQPRGELADLFDDLSIACDDAQAAFKPLSVNQMNFRPSDGTHTPRWNAEHMMARELLFFTQIYARRDSAIAPIDLNPAQMPEDYQPAHPDWTGAEEARQIERAHALVRRFAYLLDGLDLDDPAPGSRWPPGGLLRRLDAHYSQHTDNVHKKFLLPEWPKE
jgi:hypothetical protein